MILGIDYSLTSTGLAVLCDDGSTDTCIIRSPKDDGSIESIVHRIEQIADEVEAWADLAADDIVVLEGFVNHARSPHRGKIAAGWWAVARRVSMLTESPVIVVPPKTRAKYATGNGAAGKQAVVEQVTARYPQFRIDGSDDIADAVALVAIGARMLGRPIDPELPETNRSALNTIMEKGS
ncbi:crossover junction endodeoxyribonuclease RuvC [Microbacterium sp. YY-01]|uniref:crossover junction endodeoxyribonuclease RuvC n=1 Tax=Microbacterium sp. YY-01 TaxID=3421634 RepID=UPI003D16554E